MHILQKPKYQFYFFLLIFFVINVLQSKYTGLLYDEAYYWVWSQKMAFGYFDHPPMVAVWVKISGLFFENELGVRFFSIVSFTFMLYIIWLLIDIKEKWNYVWLYFLLIISVALLNAYGFITTPDTPLLFFVTLFLYFYKRFLEDYSLKNTLLLGFSMAGMIYSKYHGILIIFFVLLSNWALLSNRKFWMASFFGAVLFIPHLHWQYLNDFPTFRYHLFERGSDREYEISNSLMHLINQIAIVGITFPLIYYAFIKQKSHSIFDKSLKYITYGMIGFFLFSSFKLQPQAQWTAVILIPLVIFSFRQFVENENQRKWIIKIGMIQLGLLLIVRFLFAFDNILPIKLEPHIAKTWVRTLRENTSNKPIVFVSSYKNAAIYNFYTNIKTHSYSALERRKSQYDLGDFEDRIQGEDIYVVGVERWLKSSPELAIQNKNPLIGHSLQAYNTFQKVNCTIDNKILSFKENENITFKFTLQNTYDKIISFENAKFVGVFYHKKNIIKKVPMEIIDLTVLEPNEKKIFEITFVSPHFEDKEDLSFRMAIQFYELPEGFQGNQVNIKLIN